MSTTPIFKNTFDLVICRVALPYMHVNRALFEMFRILNEGGELWLGVALRHDRQRTVGHLRQLKSKTTIYRLWAWAMACRCIFSAGNGAGCSIPNV